MTRDRSPRGAPGSPEQARGDPSERARGDASERARGDASERARGDASEREGGVPAARSSRMTTDAADARDLEPRDHRDDDEAVVAEPVDSVDEDAPVTVGELIEGARGAASEMSQAMAGAASTVGGAARRLFDQGRYRKVRISRKGKPVLPDIPIAAAAAMQAASMVGGGIARVLAVNLGAKLLFDVEVVNEADKYVAKAHASLLDGDVVRAREALATARRMDDRSAGVELLAGVIARLEGDGARARGHLERARALDPLGETGKRAEQILTALDGSEGARRP